MTTLQLVGMGFIILSVVSYLIQINQPSYYKAIGWNITAVIFGIGSAIVALLT